MNKLEGTKDDKFPAIANSSGYGSGFYFYSWLMSLWKAMYTKDPMLVKASIFHPIPQHKGFTVPFTYKIKPKTVATHRLTGHKREKGQREDGESKLWHQLLKFSSHSGMEAL